MAAVIASSAAVASVPCCGLLLSNMENTRYSPRGSWRSPTIPARDPPNPSSLPQTRRGGVFHAIFERAIHSGHRQRRKKCFAPGLPQARSSESYNARAASPDRRAQARSRRISTTSPSATPAAFRKSRSTFSPAAVEPTPNFSRPTVRKSNFRMKILADFVGDANDFQQRLRNMLGKNQRELAPVSPSAHRQLGVVENRLAGRSSSTAARRAAREFRLSPRPRAPPAIA